MVICLLQFGTRRMKVCSSLQPIDESSNYVADQFRELCKLEADLSEMCTDATLMVARPPIPLSLPPMSYWKLRFDVEVKLGTTELEAAIKWEQNVRYPTPFHTFCMS